MNVPDDALAEDQILRRRNFDYLLLDEHKFKCPLPFIRQEQYASSACVVVPDLVSPNQSEEEIERLRQNRILTKQKVSSIFNRYFPRGIRPNSTKSLMEEYKDAVALYGLDENSTMDITVDELDRRYTELYVECVQAFDDATKFGLLADEDVDKKIRHVLDRLKTSRELVGFLCRNAVCSAPGGLSGEIGQSKDDHAMWRFSSRSSQDSDFNSYQYVLLHLINRAQSMGLRRYRNSMMGPIRTESGIATGAWKPVATFKDFVLDITETKLENDGMWYHLTKDRGCCKAAEEYLSVSKDREMPWLEPDRHVFCFKNGMYLAKDERFVPYTDFENAFPHGPPVACKYFDIELDVESIARAEDYMELKTPAFEQILNSQFLSVTLKRWVYALFIGRMLYDVGELDDYQIHVFVKGAGNTGKSKILETIASIYDEQDVGILPNNIEEKFGLAPIVHKFVAIADDVRKNLKLDQSDFQNMSSGNRVSCPNKNKDPIVVPKWKCGVAWSGNEVPNFHDNSGSYSRRMVILLFAYVVVNVDMTLMDRLLAELPMLIVKGNMAYRNMLRRYGDKKGIWEVLPREFKEQKNELASTNNALMNFFNSGKLVFGTRKYMPIEILRDRVMDHAKKNGFATPSWTKDYYRDPFHRYGLKTTAYTEKVWPRSQNVPKDQQYKTKAVYVMGCDLDTSSGTGNSNNNGAGGGGEDEASGITATNNTARPPPVLDA